LRAKLTISYNGAKFDGFARQKGGERTVVGELEKALSGIGVHSGVMGAGRTDAGVHALRQCVAFDLPSYVSDEEKFARDLSRKLPDGIGIRRVEFVSDDFQPRYGVKRRAYRYAVKVGAPNPFESAFVHFVSELDYERVKLAVRLFEGEHDFSYFMKTGGKDKKTVRDMNIAKCYRKGEYIFFYFESKGFLRSQVRLMVGMLLSISEGKLDESDLQDQLNLRARPLTKPAPASGLYFAKVAY